MQIQPRLSSEEIADLFQIVETSRPAYSQLCSFFKALFTLQQSTLATGRPSVAPLDPQHNTARRQAELPLIQRDRLWVDWPATHGLFTELLALAPEANAQLARSAEAIMERYRSNNLDLETWGPLLLKDDSAAFERRAAESGLAADVLAFFLYHSLWPSAARHLEAAAPHLPAAEAWQKGYCPFCGSTPMLSVLAQEGHRYLVCGFCRHTWPAPRLFCPFCENREPETLGYFYSEAEKEYRVNTCQACKGYLKAIDLRQLARPLLLPLEAVITAHLDMTAQDQGYRDMTPVWLRL